MSTENPDTSSKETISGPQRPLFVSIIAILLGCGVVGVIVGGILLTVRSEAGMPDSLLILLAAIVVGALGLLLTRGLWMLKDWARTAIVTLLGLGLFVFLLLPSLFGVAAEIFAGERVMPLGAIAESLFNGAGWVVMWGFIPGLIIYGLVRLAPYFDETPAQRDFIDSSLRYVLIVSALSAIFIVFLIILFTMRGAWESIEEIGLERMLLGTIWRPGSIIGTVGQYGLMPMIAGSILSTFGAVVLGVPLALGAAILLAEIAPPPVRETLRPAVELLAGIPSVVYGLFGMVVLAPLIRFIDVPYNTGFGLLNASIILAIMILPTVANIAEDAIRAVPQSYKEGSLALGTTHWQTIWSVILPAARSGIVAAIILGIGRALGETMALIMVIGNSIAMPAPLTDNPLTIFLSSARTLTGNIAVEINYAEGAHRSALFFTGILLFVMIFIVNSIARYLMRERLAS
jgi:phosphate transport system permease protein